MNIMWVIAMVAIAVVLAVLSRGMPRMLSVIAIAVSLAATLTQIALGPQLFDMMGAVGTGLVFGVLSIGSQVVTLGLLIAAAAIASRPAATPPTSTVPGGVH